MIGPKFLLQSLKDWPFGVQTPSHLESR